MNVPESVCTCSKCKKTEPFRWTRAQSFKLPDGWMFRTRSWGDEDWEPDEMEIACPACLP